VNRKKISPLWKKEKPGHKQPTEKRENETRRGRYRRGRRRRGRKNTILEATRYIRLE
jgi:hypothetical protein